MSAASRDRRELWESDSLDRLPGADNPFLFCQRSDSLSGQEKEKWMPGETQVELSDTCSGTGFQPFALPSFLWNSWST